MSTRNYYGENNPSWKGENIKYGAIHDWLKSAFGKAYKCENSRCTGTSKNYNWCLIKGFNYERKRENFIQFCVSCHRKYDFKEEYRERIRKLHIGKKHSREHEEKRLKKVIGSKHKLVEKVCDSCQIKFLSKTKTKTLCGSYANKSGCTYSRAKLRIVESNKKRRNDPKYKKLIKSNLNG